MSFDDTPRHERTRGRPKGPGRPRARTARQRVEDAVNTIVREELLDEYHVEDAEERAKILRAWMMYGIESCAKQGDLDLMHKFLTLAARDTETGILPSPTGTNVNVAVVGAPTKGAPTPHLHAPTMAPELQALALAALPSGEEESEDALPIQDAEVVENE